MSTDWLDPIELGNYLNAFLLNAGSSNVAVNGSVTPVTFKYTAPDGFNAYIHRINFTMIDATKAFEANEFGPLSALSTGINFGIIDAEGRESTSITNDLFIKNNGQFGNFAGVDVRTLAADKGLGVRWTLSKATGGRPVKLPPNWSVFLRVNDNLSSIDEIRANVQGMIGGVGETF